MEPFRRIERWSSTPRILIALAMLAALIMSGGTMAHPAEAAPTGQVVVDPGWDGGGQIVPTGVDAVALQTDGGVIIGGMFSQVSGQQRSRLARLDGHGILDASFHPAVTGGMGVFAIVVQPDGKVIIGGSFTSVAGVSRPGLARLTSGGALDPTFDPGTGVGLANQMSQGVQTLSLQPDGRILLGGDFTSFNGVARSGLARVTATGALDASFQPGAGVAGGQTPQVKSMALQPDGRLVIGGDFTSYAGVPRTDVARVNADGSLDRSFNPGSGPDANVTSLDLLADGRVMIGGTFSAVNGVPRSRIARLLPSGAVDPAFNPGTGVTGNWWGTYVLGVTAYGDGSVLVGGNFTHYNGAPRSCLTRILPSGAVDPSFDQGSGTACAQGGIIAPIVMADGRIVIAGNFTGFNGAQPEPSGITRLQPPVSAPTAPMSLAAAAGDASILLTFGAPANFGGAELIGYSYSLDDGATWWQRYGQRQSTPAREIAVWGLTNGTTYHVRVRAISNLAGVWGEVSAAVAVRPQASPGSVFVPVAPSRVLDTRTSAGGAGPLAAGESRVVSVASAQAGGSTIVPSGATAVAYNVTVPNPGTSGHLRLMPADAAGTTAASAINFRANETIANGSTVAVDAQRQIRIYAAARADVILDVVGYFVPTDPTPAAGSKFTPLTPTRVYDADADAAGRLPAGNSRVVSVASAQVGGAAVVPAGASAVAYNITVVRPTGPGHLRVMPGNVESTATSAINWATSGEVIANGSVVALGGDRTIRVYNAATVPVRFLIDVVGYYSAGGALFHPIDPVRVSDSRFAAAGPGPVSAGVPGIRTLGVGSNGTGGFTVAPAGSVAVAYNLTVADTAASGHLRVFPADAPLVGASTINWPGAGYTRANGTVVGVSPQREVKVYNGAGLPTEVLVDVVGYYK